MKQKLIILIYDFMMTYSATFIHSYLKFLFLFFYI